MLGKRPKPRDAFSRGSIFPLEQEQVMGLDAFVRCGALRRAGLRPPSAHGGPLDDDGYVWSHALTRNTKRLGREEYSRRYNDLEHQLIRWCDTCCKHEGMHICDEWVCNSSGWSELQWLSFQQLGDLTPTLADMLPNGNGGIFSCRARRKSFGRARPLGKGGSGSDARKVHEPDQLRGWSCLLDPSKWG